MRVYRDEDVDRALVRGRRVAIIGYGNQGRAQALNLADSGVGDIVIGLRPGSPRADQARQDGFAVAAPAEAVAPADLVMMLAPDERQAQIYCESIAPYLPEKSALGFSHGLAIRFGLIAPRPDLDIFLVAPKGPGTALRQLYGEGRGMVALFAVAQDASGQAEALALSYAAALGCGRAGILPTSFAEECEADLFNEQAVLWGAIPELIQAGFETLVEAGFSPEIAYFECLTEVKLIADLIAERGIAGMREAISTTARFGAMEGGPRIITDETRAEMRRILAEVRDGRFTRKFVAEAAEGHPRMRAWSDAAAAHPIEAIGSRLRGLEDEMIADGATNQHEKAGVNAEEGEVLAAMDRLGELVWNRDPAAIEEFSEAADVLLIGSEEGETVCGRAQIATFLEELFQLPVRLRWDWRKRAASRSGTIAWVSADAEVVVQSGEGEARKAYRITGVLEKLEDRWRWRQFHGSEPVPPPAQ